MKKLNNEEKFSKKSSKKSKKRSLSDTPRKSKRLNRNELLEDF